MSEERVPIGTLKARLSEYLRRAKAGETLIVTDRGTPVARLLPLSGLTARAGRLEELERAGLLGRPSASLDLDLLATDRPTDPEGRSLEAVLEERAEGW